MNAQLARAWARLAVARQIGRAATTRKSLDTIVALDSLAYIRGRIPHFERTVRTFSSSRLQCFYGSASRLAAILPPQPVSPKIPKFCPGCGVTLQQNDPNAPGYFQIPKSLQEPTKVVESEETAEEHADSGKTESSDKQLELFDQLIDEWDQPRKRPSLDIRQYKEQEEDFDYASIRCARCHSLQHNGRVKSEVAEAQLPAFDFGKKVGQKIALTKFRKQVLLTVVDVADWEGSFPSETLRSILDAQRPETGSIYDDGRSASTRGRVPSNFTWIVAANKADLLPTQRQHIEFWVRSRLAKAGFPKPASVVAVSSYRGWGIANLLARLQHSVGDRGDVYVVGVQNAGKSSLVNAMRGAAGLSRAHDVTAAAVPGTTLGMLRVPGLLPTGCQMLDTPGMSRPGSVTALLTPADVKLLQSRRAFKPRTYRLGASQTVLLGGLARIDVLSQEQGSTIYLTIWASDALPCHMGKTDGAEERRTKHLGTRLRPPSGTQEAARFPNLRPQHINVEGTDWRRSSQDIAIAGLGWIGVGLVGRAELAVWTPKDVHVSVRDALARDLSPQLEKRGFGTVVGDVPKIDTTNVMSNDECDVSGHMSVDP